MNMDRETYKKYADAHAPSSPMLKNCLWAFFSGGLICAVGLCLIWLFSSLGFEDKHASTLTSVTIVFVAVILTALGLFEKKIGRAHV